MNNSWKVCTKCRKQRPLSEFHKNKDGVLGRYSRCKECKTTKDMAHSRIPEVMARRSENDRQYRQSEAGKNVSKRYCQSKKGRKARRARDAKRQTQKDYPAKRRARDAVRYAVKVGRWPAAKTSECVYCGEQAVFWHHWAGYEKEHYLDIIPLCQKCDREAHKEAS